MDNILILVLMLLGTVSLPVLLSIFGTLTMEELGMHPTDAPRIYVKMIIRLILVGAVSIGILSAVLAFFVK